MDEEAQYTVSEWVGGYWRWQCVSPRRHGCYGILGPPATREDAADAAAHHRAEVHEGLLTDLGAPAPSDRERLGGHRDDHRPSGKGMAHDLAWFAQRASDQRRRPD